MRDKRRAVVLLRIFHAFTGVLFLIVSAFGLYIYFQDKASWPNIALALLFALIGLGLVWRAAVGWTKPEDALGAPINWWWRGGG